MTLKIIISIALFLLIGASGAALHKTGRPYNGLYFNIHKIIALVFVVFTAIWLIGYPGTTGLDTTIILLFIAGILSVIALFATGTMLSLGKLSPEKLVIVHRTATIILVLSIVSIAYLMLRALK